MQLTPQTDSAISTVLHLAQVEMCEELQQTFNVQLVSGIRSNLKHMLMPALDKIMLRRRAIAEAIFDRPKNISRIEYFPYRSPINSLVNLLWGVIADCPQPRNPSLSFGILPALIS
jgi:DDE family transposase